MSLINLIDSNIKSIQAFKQKLEHANKQINIEQSINSFINNYYDMIYYYEQALFCYCNVRDYNSNDSCFINYPYKMFKRIDNLKKRAVAYNEIMHSQDQSVNTNNDFIFDKNNAISSEDTYELLLEDYIDSIDSFLNTTNVMNSVISYYYDYMPYSFFNKTSNYMKHDIMSFIQLLFNNINPCDVKEHNNLLVIESTNVHVINLSYIIDNSNADMYNKYLITTNIAEDLYDKHIFGLIDQCKISNNAFNVIICNALEYKNTEDGKTISYKSLINSLKCLSPDGVLCYLTFDFCLTKNTCSILAKYLTNVKIKYNAENHLALIVGIRRKDKIPDQNLYNRLRHLLIAKQDIEDNIDNIIHLSKPTNEIKTFIGSELNSQALQSFINKYNIFQDMYNAQNTQIDMQDSKRPLLPFSVGQLGLVLTSGCLNGIIEETDCNGEVIGAHAIKGVVEKEISNSISIDENRYRIEESITNNKVHINVFKSNGDLITLT